MKQFDRYLLNRYLRILGGIFALFITLLVVYILLDEMQLFIDYKAGWFLIVRYCVLSMPFLIVSFFPLVLLLGAIFTLHQLIKWGEMTGIMVSGASFRQLSLVFITVGFLLGIIQFLSNEYAAAWCEDQARQVKNFEIKKMKFQGVAGQAGNFVRGGENRFYHSLFFDRDRKILQKVSVFQLDSSDQHLASFIQAASAYYENEEWIFKNGQETLLKYDEIISNTPFEQLRIRLPETAVDFAGLTLDPRRMSFRRLLGYMRMMKSSGEDPSRHRTELLLKITFPFSCVIFTLIALVVAFCMKAGNLTIELGLAVILALAYYALTSAMADMGMRQAIPAWMAAGGSSFLFGTVSLLAFLFMRTDYS